MCKKKCAGVVLLICFSLTCFQDYADALLSDKKSGKWNLVGRVKTQASFRTTDTPDNNQVPIEKGDMTSQRNLLLVDFKHDLGEFNFPAALFLPDTEPQVEYFVQFRAFYNSIYDHGPDVFSDKDTRRYYSLENSDELDDLTSDADIFLGYVDLTWGEFFMRLGRQKLAWGEMSFMSVMDICPQDNSSLDVDVLERLMPLDMLRANLAFYDVGPMSSLSIEGFYVPGSLDSTTGERVPLGTPLVPPTYRNTPDQPDPVGALVEFANMMEDDIEDDRYGIKVGAMLGDLEISLIYYRAYSSMLVPALDLDRMDWNRIDMAGFVGSLMSGGDTDVLSDLPSILNGVLGDQKLPVIETYAQVETYGTSFNYLISSINTVIRGEVALFKDVPKMPIGGIPGLFDEVLQRSSLPSSLSGVDGDMIGMMLGSDLADAALPFAINRASIPTYDVWKWGIGLDKNISIKFINPKKEIMLMFEYVEGKIKDWAPDTILIAWSGPNGETLFEEEYFTNFSLMARTDYMNGFITPQILIFYEVQPKAWTFGPSVTLTKGSFTCELGAFITTTDTYDGMKGNLDCKDEVKFALTYSF